MLGTLAVGGDPAGHFHAQGPKRLQEGIVIRSLTGDGGVSGKAVGQHQAGVVGGGVPVHADHVEGLVHHLLQRYL